MSEPVCKGAVDSDVVGCYCSNATNPKATRPPPQVKQTVEAVSGHWVGQMTASLPRARPEQFPWEMTCNVVALGSGAACSMNGTASIGPIEACLVAYDPEGKAVHFM